MSRQRESEILQQVADEANRALAELPDDHPLKTAAQQKGLIGRIRIVAEPFSKGRMAEAPVDATAEDVNQPTKPETEPRQGNATS